MKIRSVLIAVTAFGLTSYLPAIAQEQKPPTLAQQASGGEASASEPSFKMVRSVSGTKIFLESGRITVEDPRTVFYAPADKKIVVHFTWEGPPGPHHFEGLWKNPTGKVAMTSDFDYQPDIVWRTFFRMVE